MSSKLRKMVKRHSTSTSAGHGPVMEIRSDKQFRDLVTNADTPVMVDFWAPWCQPCRMQGPAFAAAASELGSTVRFVKVNTEASPSLARSFNISSIPALLAFSRGEVVDARVGLSPKSAVVTMARRTLDRHHGVGMVGKIKRFFSSEQEPAAEPQV